MTKIENDVALADKTTYKIGGKSRFYSKPESQDDLVELLIWSKKKYAELFVLGRGSNVLISDKGWNGLTIDLSALNSIKWQDGFLICESGVLLHTLVKESVKKKCHGLEMLAGIPGSVGGGIVMNAGAFGGNISDHLIDVKVIDTESAEIYTLAKSDLDFGYRTSRLKKSSKIILSAKFKFTLDVKGNRLENIFRDILKKRNKKQPLNLPNCGSVFKRPEGNFAGTLIESCGLKGFSIGGAKVSEKHANFIVNDSGARAEDVYLLIKHIQNVVYREKKIYLEPEVILIGEFQ